jgi:DNA-binding MarR family transcriptional regulator
MAPENIEEDQMSEPEAEWLSPRDKVRLARFRLVIKYLLSMHRRMTTTQAITFLQVAMAEGELTVSMLAAVCGVGPTTISKHLRDLGAINRRGEPSLGLITTMQRAHDDRRQHRVILTDRGVAVARIIVAIMKGEHLSPLVGQRCTLVIERDALVLPLDSPR